MKLAAIALLAALTLTACSSLPKDTWPRWADPAWESKGGGGSD